MSAERTEVLSGVLRRRNWSAELKEQIVSKTLEPGVTFTEVAHRHEVDRSLVCRWRREVGVMRLAGVEIELLAGVRVRVTRPVDSAALAHVLQALGHR